MIRRPPRSTLFPTRRSSDLYPDWLHTSMRKHYPGVEVTQVDKAKALDRKSTRLNSSHVAISYAVFCLKKKKKKKKNKKQKRNKTLNSEHDDDKLTEIIDKAS